MNIAQLNDEYDRKLKAMSGTYERSKVTQVRFWINREYAELERMKLLPVAVVDEETPRDAQAAFCQV